MGDGRFSKVGSRRVVKIMVGYKIFSEKDHVSLLDPVFDVCQGSPLTPDGAWEIPLSHGVNPGFSKFQGSFSLPDHSSVC